MKIPKEIIDNSEGNKLISFLNSVLTENPKTGFDVASAFFNIQAFAMIKDNLGGVEHFRLLLGKAPEINNEVTLGHILLQEVRKEVEGLDLSKDSELIVKEFIKFLNKKNVEVRLFEKFLHGKTYIFNDLVVIGSSNFTAAGLTRYGELNTWGRESQAVYTRKEWFEKFWDESRPFKDELISLLEDSRFGSKEYSPYEIYIKSLYELQKDEMKEEEKKESAQKGLPETKVNLAEFQDDAISRVHTRLKKYRSVLIADSVGLGKTWIAKKVLEKIGYYERKNILIVCPAQLREMWSRELKKIDVKENILSQEDLASKDFIKKAQRVVGGNLTSVELVVVDESHNFRNPLSNRWENFFTLMHENIAKKGNRPYILFMTATPINNTIWDLYWQVMLLTLMDKSTFVKENIPDLFKFFKEVDKRQNPALLNDLLNEVSIRRTRAYIKDNYPEAYILRELPGGEVKEQKVIFPDRILENISYELDKTYQGMYKEISDVITHKLTMAYYKILEYKKTEKLTTDEQLILGRMIAIGGIFRTILLKRLESSVEAFRKSVLSHLKFLDRLKKYIRKGKLLTKESFRKYLLQMDEELEEEQIIDVLDDFKAKDYRVDELIKDVDKDMKLLVEITRKVSQIKPEHDAKLKVLMKKLIELSKDSQVVLFTYYADTLDYIFKQIKASKDFSKLKIEAISSSGKTHKDPKVRERIKDDFINKKIDILMSTDVLSEGQNLQSAKYLINYDLHWNPTRMIQRAGRIDRIGSPYKKIFVYNFFPEDELEALLRLVSILQEKIINIDKSVGLDQTILGEEIHPKVFGIIRRIREKDGSVFDDLEQDVYGGGERFYQPLKDFLKNRAIEDLEKIPLGVHSGLKKEKISGIFLYYKYREDFHFWYVYDLASNSLIKNKTEIIDFISCPPSEKRVIPDFFEKVYEINREILEDIERTYKEIELSKTQDSALKELTRERSSKFIKSMITEIELQIDEYLTEFPEDDSIEKFWEPTKTKLLSIPYTKHRLKELRHFWKEYKKKGDWKGLIKELSGFLIEKGLHKKSPVEPYDSSKLKLVAIDFIS
ncbi:MAG: DEAD/DEAH box helicase family protein [Deltaproteobacteria bacterium]|nr:DEAD/DEAH box helicase family protein [Deltaproteobacteria bacterium]